MAASITTFRNVRSRLKRLNGNTWLAGWVTHLAREESRIRLWNNVPMVLGERVSCECYGQGIVARFQGKVLAQASENLAITVLGSISYAPSEETPRIYASGLVGQLEGPNGAANMNVLDLSPQSLGATVDVEFNIGTVLTMHLSTEMGPIEACVSVANSRPDPALHGHFRVGMHILDIQRLDRARWGRLVSERAEA